MEDHKQGTTIKTDCSAQEATNFNSFGLTIQCDPVIVVPGEYVLLLVFDTTPNGLLFRPVNLAIRSRETRNFVYYDSHNEIDDRGSSTIPLYIGSEFLTGGYDVLASYESTDTVAIATFHVARVGFRGAIEDLNEASALRAQAATLFQYADYTQAIAMLLDSCQEYSYLGCYDAAILGYQDLSVISVEAGDIESATLTVRFGLLNVLASACSKVVTSDNEISLEDALPPDLLLDAVGINEWQSQPFVEAAKQLGIGLAVSSVRPVVTVLELLFDLREDHPFFFEILRRGTQSSEYKFVCETLLAKFTERLLFPPALARLIVSVEQSAAVDDSDLPETLRALGKKTVIDNLASILLCLTPGAQIILIKALIKIWQVQCVVQNDYVHLYDKAGLIGRLSNRDRATFELTMTSNDTDFSEVRALAMGAGG